MKRCLVVLLLMAGVAIAGCMSRLPGDGARPLVIGIAERCGSPRDVCCRSTYARAIFAASARVIS